MLFREPAPPAVGPACPSRMVGTQMKAIVAAPVVPPGRERFIRLVVPELQRRGLFRREYEGRILRGNLGLERPANRFFPE